MQKKSNGPKDVNGVAVYDMVSDCVSVNPSCFMRNADLAHFTRPENILCSQFCFYNKRKTSASAGGH